MNYRKYVVQKETRIEQEVNNHLSSSINKLNKELQDPKSNSDEIVFAKKHELLSRIAIEEKNLIEHELKVLDLPNIEGNEVLE